MVEGLTSNEGCFWQDCNAGDNWCIALDCLIVKGKEVQ
jgi:hypothetical protein